MFKRSTHPIDRHSADNSPHLRGGWNSWTLPFKENKKWEKWTQRNVK